ncbi:MAG: hypothetical protein J5804_06765 [Eggerthellaceae bacterium]|nr:hypothetical protein [Eggerthellaceae bacterium]
MILAIAAGVAAGIVGFIPLFVSMQLSKRFLSVSMMNTALHGLVGVLISMVILAVELYACAKVAHDAVLPFGLAEMIALVASTSVYTLVRNGIVGRKKR